MLLSGPPSDFFIEKFLSQNARFDTKSFIELVTKYLMKFEMKIDGHFRSLGKEGFEYIRNPFTANDQMLQTETGTQEKLVKLQYNDFTRDVYSEKQVM